MTTKAIRLGENTFVSAQEAFLSVDIDSEKKSLQKEGQANGRVNSPDSQASQMDAVELEIIRKVTQTAERTQRALRQHFVGFFECLLPIVKALKPQALINQIKSMSRQVENNLSGMLSDFQDKSAISGEEWRQAKAEHKKFRQDNELIRPSDHLALRSIIPWFVILIVVEATLNATLLWELTGILTAFGQTALITSVNVLFGAALVGLCFRYKNHVSWKARWLTLICIPGVVAVLTFNFGVGHYRDALVEAKAHGEQYLGDLDWDDDAEPVGLDFVDHTKKAMKSIKASPFKIDSVLSGLLIIIGVGFFGLAAHTWYSMLDPYPGYRKRTLALEEKHRNYQNLVAKTRVMMKQEINDAETRVSDERTKIMNIRAQHNALTNRAQTLQIDYAGWSGVLEKTQNQLLAVYRDCNKQSRSEPAPKHFNESIPIDDMLSKPPSFTPPDLQNIETETEAVIQAVEESTNKIQETSDAIWKKFNQIADMQERSNESRLPNS